ncbi:DUF3313 family protein [Paraglaciecola aquimarina]|uniref:DUF3313 family protein n=1 Tax=Paraglaciecola algarum TaxID=3050085 RepID=A0ABS9D985_9ALTE|nr:DUF3313 family protein [Paraglaciecola sp. G1-23]MCF2949484.1 DUF3313 family protein [Paraglaciecola sp. G1-23]
MNRLYSVFLMILISGCAGFGLQPELSVKPLATSELQMVENSNFDRFVIANGQDFQSFNKVIFFAMQFDRLSIDKSADKELRNSWNESSWDEMDAICQHFDDFAAKIFSERDGFAITNQGGEDVLAIEFRLMNFVPYSKRYNDAGLSTVGTSSNEKGVGTITFQAVIANAKTGDLLAVIEDGMEVNAGNRMIVTGDLSLQINSNNKASQNRAWRKVFKRWVSLLHEDLTRLQTKNPTT